jgi:hypothetical protein
MYELRRRILENVARGLLAIAVLGVAVADPAVAQTVLEEDPIRYFETPARDAVARLWARIERGEANLEYDLSFGYLPALLRELDVPFSSQVLVFSKTSLQVRYISPMNPRAIYFGDDVYLGWVQGSEIMEISTVDPQLGAVFYTVDQEQRTPRIERKRYECLQCHTSTLTQGVPGHTVRSVFPNPDGSLQTRLPTYLTNHQSPLRERWGGWYVTGRHGEQKHMGNSLYLGGELRTDYAFNVTRLEDRFPASQWLTPHSDIVALMVLEHQTHLHNLITQASFDARRAIFQEQQIAGECVETDHRFSPITERQFDTAAARIVNYMLFSDEAPLSEPLEGTTAFAKDFAARGPRDSRGRSLRDFDLQRRMFQYPCSYLIYSEAFVASIRGCGTS